MIAELRIMTPVPHSPTALLSSPSEHHYDEPHAMFLSKRMEAAHGSGGDSEASQASSPASRAHQGAAVDSGTGRSHSSYCSSREYATCGGEEGGDAPREAGASGCERKWRVLQCESVVSCCA